MKCGERHNTILLALSFIFLLTGWFNVDASSYDYTASMECLPSPPKPLYGGGIIVNAEYNKGLKGWSNFGNAKITRRKLHGGKRFISAHGRTHQYDSVSQKIDLQKDMLYTLSAWIQVSEGSVPVTAVFKTSSGYKHAGAIIAESKCWSMLKGGLTADASSPAELYFESRNTSVEIRVASVSLQPFTQQEWKSHQVQSIEKTRKAKVRIQAVDKQGLPLKNATISIEQNRSGFPFGCAINKNILSNTDYQNWFTSRFKVTTFENEMKWYSTEASQGQVDYSTSDALFAFAKQHNVQVRGHNVVWDDPNYQQGWIKSLSPDDLLKAVESRVNSVMTRYKGQVIAWDVVNEDLHFNFYESKLGQTASALIYNIAQKVDGVTTLFLNDYNTIEEKGDAASSPANFLQKLRDIQSYPGNSNLKLGIGLESHFATPDLAYMRSSLDMLGATNFPVWLTEVDVQSGPNQATYLDQILREALSHPKVAGIVIWSAWSPQGCYRMCLTDNNFRNLPTGDVVDKLLHELSGNVVGTTDDKGFFEASHFHGDYIVKINHTQEKFSLDHEFQITPSSATTKNTLILKVA